jgi:hypothetical protein
MKNTSMTIRKMASRFSHLTCIRVLCIVLFVAESAPAQLGGRAGAYTQMGFGARGMGMGNALTAVTTGDIAGYYNPATLPYAEYRNVSASFGILSLDRKLNFLSYSQPVKPNAGIAIGLINSGVSKIDGRDNNGEPTGDLRTSENQLFLAFGGRPKGTLALGVAAKLLYNHLYSDLTSVTIGLDFGALLPIDDSFTVGVAVKDLLSKYKWDTGELYGSLKGRQSQGMFPVLVTVGGTYKLPENLGIVSLDVVASDQSTLMCRAGTEIQVVPQFTLRAGIDRMDLKEKGNGVKPSFGFSLTNDFDGFVMGLHYAFQVEPFSPQPLHVISLSAAL